MFPADDRFVAPGPVPARDLRRQRSPGGRENNGWGGSRPGSGRKPKPDPVQAKTVSVYLHVEYVEYLNAWDADNTSHAVREVLDRARSMWPKGV